MADSRLASGVHAPRGAALAFAALAIALGPVWPGWLQHAFDAPWARVSPAFAVLLAFATWASREQAETPRAPRLGAVVALAAAGVAMLLVGAVMPRFARLALPVGILGLAARYGRPPFAVALLGLWLVPLPSFALGLMSPGLERLWLQIAAGFAPNEASLGFKIEAVDAGLGLAWILAGLGYYAAWRVCGTAGPARARWITAALAAGCAPLLQIAALGLALTCAAGGDVASARQLLREGPWIVALAIGLVAPELIRWQRREAISAG